MHQGFNFYQPVKHIVPPKSELYDLKIHNKSFIAMKINCVIKSFFLQQNLLFL